MKNYKLGLLALFCLLFDCNIASSDNCTFPTPEAILNNLANVDGRVVVSNLTTEGCSHWDNFLQEVSLGHAKWLVVAGRLFRYTDAGATEDLLMSLSTALLHNPEGVLREIQKESLPLKDICGVRLIEPTNEEVRSFAKNALSSLRGVKNEEVKFYRDSCQKEFEKDLARLRFQAVKDRSKKSTSNQ